jgi:hypothetical protein
MTLAGAFFAGDDAATPGAGELFSTEALAFLFKGSICAACIGCIPS